MITFDLLKRAYGIGLTGGIATGKSVVSTLLRDLGHEVVDADVLAREAVLPRSRGLTVIVQQFGPGILQDGSLNRRKLRDLIFADASKKKIVENILHPHIRELLQEKLRQRDFFTKPRLWFYEATLLVETGTWREFKQLWVTHCSPATQITRLRERNNLSLTEAKKIITAQLPNEVRLQKADLGISTEDDDKDKLKNLLARSLLSIANK